MGNDIEIGIAVLVSIIIGGMFRTIKGAYFDRPKGEDFSWRKFGSSTIIVIFESIIAFLPINFVDFGVSGMGLFGMIIAGLALGYFGSKSVPKALSAISKVVKK